MEKEYKILNDIPTLTEIVESESVVSLSEPMETETLIEDFCSLVLNDLRQNLRQKMLDQLDLCLTEQLTQIEPLLKKHIEVLLHPVFNSKT